MQQLTKIFISNTFTKEQVSHRLALLRAFLEEVVFISDRKNGFDFNKLDYFLKQKNEPIMVIDNFKEWGENFYEKFNQDNLYELVNKIDKEIQELPSILLYVPINLPFEQTQKLGLWLRQNLQKNILIELKVDLAVTGGCAFVWNDVYYDFSFRYFLNKNRNKFIETLNQYAKK